MTTHQFQPTGYHPTRGSHPPVLNIAEGDTVITTTVDAFGKDAHNQSVTAGGNPQTGPFYIDGTQPGDVLVVYLDRLFPNREIGYSRNVLASNVVDPGFVSQLPTSQLVEWRLDPTRRTARLLNPDTRLKDLALPLSPMLGCFGVAPPDGQAISTATSGPHGGNMDYRGFSEGVAVHFPVFVPGALFSLGDGHALQGDGEIVGTGIEISFDVQFTVQVLKQKPIQWPHGENDEYIFTVGNARPLDQALQHATTEMLHLLEDDYHLDRLSAGVLLGQCVRYEVGNVFDPAYTMVCKLPKALLNRIAAA